MSELTQSPEWQALQAHADKIKKTSLRELFKDDARFGQMSIDNRDVGMLLDYSKNLAAPETMDLLHALAERVDVSGKARDMFSGRKINWNPVKEEIVGDADASGMLTRAMREPWQL